MALDGILLHKIIPEIETVLPCRIQKIYEISSTEILFQIHTSEGRKQLLISCHSLYNRILLSKRNYPTPNEPGNFVMVLRKYLEGASLESLHQGDLDRWCAFKVRRHNNLGDLEYLDLYVELMGKYANVILVDQNGRIIDALKRIPPFENSRRTIQPGALFTLTPAQEKKNPFTDQTIDPSQTLTAQFSGFSPFLEREVQYRLQNGQSFHSIMDEINSSSRLYIANQDNEAVFHCIPLTSLGSCTDYSLFEGFEILYFHKEEKERIKQITGDLYHFVRKQLKHQNQKLPRLLKEFDEAKDCQKWNKYGELLYAHQIEETNGKREIELEDYESGSLIRIPLDPKLNGRKNAQKCYAKYNKLKKGQVYLEEQIRLCNMEISYFTGLLQQLDQADFDTAAEMKEELIKLGYLKEKNQKNRRRHKKNEEGPHITTLKLTDSISISFGRNNLQNEALTFHRARKTDTWLHAKDYHGAHVVINDPSPDESVLRLAANIAAYFSAGRQSSSVPVVYCPVKGLKKIPGAKPGMVQLSSYKTIYIDPDEELLEKAGVDIS